LLSFPILEAPEVSVRTVIGVFARHEAALNAGEKAREVTRSGHRIRIFLPGDKGATVESAVMNDKASFVHVLVVSVTIGLLGAAILAALGARGLYVALWLGWSILSGLMVGAWLNGQRFPRHLLQAHERLRAQCAREVNAGHAVVTALVDSQAEAERVGKAFKSAGGHVIEGFVSEHAQSHHPSHT
jgi:hypothetical protein